MFAGGGGLGIDSGSSLARFHYERGIGPTGTDNVQRTDQTEPTISTADSDETFLSIA
jgi:hypothetical protein